MVLLVSEKWSHTLSILELVSSSDSVVCQLFDLDVNDFFHLSTFLDPFLLTASFSIQNYHLKKNQSRNSMGLLGLCWKTSTSTSFHKSNSATRGRKFYPLVFLVQLPVQSYFQGKNWCYEPLIFLILTNPTLCGQLSK